MFGLSGEHLVILVIVLLIFGPKRLPAMGNTLGKAIRNFKESMAGIQEPTFRHIQEDPTKPASTTPTSGAAQETVKTASAEVNAEATDSTTKPKV